MVGGGTGRTRAKKKVQVASAAIPVRCFHRLLSSPCDSQLILLLLFNFGPVVLFCQAPFSPDGDSKASFFFRLTGGMLNIQPPYLTPFYRSVRETTPVIRAAALLLLCLRFSACCAEDRYLCGPVPLHWTIPRPISAILRFCLRRTSWIDISYPAPPSVRPSPRHRWSPGNRFQHGDKSPHCAHHAGAPKLRFR